MYRSGTYDGGPGLFDEALFGSYNASTLASKPASTRSVSSALEKRRPPPRAVGSNRSDRWVLRRPIKRSSLEHTVVAMAIPTRHLGAVFTAACQGIAMAIVPGGVG